LRTAPELAEAIEVALANGDGPTLIECIIDRNGKWLYESDSSRAMSKTFRPWDVEQRWVLPPSVHELVPAGQHD
jgi:hypothetical protein